MNEVLFYVDVTLDGEDLGIGYASVAQALRDPHLRTMFEPGHSTYCRVTQGQRQVFALPEALCTWERFEQALLEHARSILQVLT